MSRRRLISPEFFTHGELFDAERASGLPLRVAFAGLWTVADRRGLFRWRPRELKLAVLPYDTVEFQPVLEALESAGFIECYTEDGREYGRIPSFAEWQTFHPHEKPSDIPEPTNGCRVVAKDRPDNAVVTTASGTSTASTPTSTAPRKAANDEAFDAAWKNYPRRAGGNSRGKAFRAWCARSRSVNAATQMAEGVVRYAAFVRATGKEGTEYVMQGATFFGPDDHFLEPWIVPAIVVTPPRRSPGPTVTEVADKRHEQAVALEKQYQAAAHQAGARWAKQHPDDFAPIKEMVERSYRGVPAMFSADAIKGELTQRCAQACGFPSFERWQGQVMAGAT